MGRNMYRRLLMILGVVFVLSAAALLLSLGGGGGTEPGNGDPSLPEVSSEEPEPGGNLSLILSAATAAGSGVAFVVTTFFNLREDRRLSQRHELEMAKLRRELEALEARLASREAGE